MAMCMHAVKVGARRNVCFSLLRGSSRRASGKIHERI
jgi:hypothetical protein